MSEPYIAEVKIFAGNFAPRGYAFCNGALLPISQNTALFSLVGTTYGGDGRTTLGLPNLQDRLPMHAGNGPGLTSRRLGETGGVPTVTLTAGQLPAHSHGVQGSTAAGDTTSPAGAYPAAAPVYSPGASAADATMSPDAIVDAEGQGGAHNNEQPFLAMYFIIALTGVYPSRS